MLVAATFKQRVLCLSTLAADVAHDDRQAEPGIRVNLRVSKVLDRCHHVHVHLRVSVVGQHIGPLVREHPVIAPTVPFNRHPYRSNHSALAGRLLAHHHQHVRNHDVSLVDNSQDVADASHPIH